MTGDMGRDQDSAGRPTGGGSTAPTKVTWSGRLLAVQPRIDLMRSFDERQHSYRGYVLRIDGELAGEPAPPIRIAIGKAGQAKHGFQAGDSVRGASWAVPAGKHATVEFHRTSGLVVLERSIGQAGAPPPWHGVPPELPVYRVRGHRRLAARTFKASCSSCIWGCEMSVELVVDQWNPGRERHRAETFCYGPKSCSVYRAGATRKVPGRKGMSWEEEDWVDEEATAHRGPDD